MHTFAVGADNELFSLVDVILPKLVALNDMLPAEHQLESVLGIFHTPPPAEEVAQDAVVDGDAEAPATAQSPQADKPADDDA